MEQSQLRALEDQCIQEQPAQCSAACPIHVDVRSLCGHVAAANWNAAWKDLRKTMPLAGVLARICDAPCEAGCMRGQAGDSIRIGLLEKSVVAHPCPKQRLLPLPSKGKKIAVVGSGMSGLALAWDLARKGVAVTLYEPGSRIGGCLAQRFPNQLSEQLIDDELELLKQLKVTFHTDASVAGQDFLEKLLQENDAVYFCQDGGFEIAWDLDKADGKLKVDTELRTTSRENVLAGGDVDSPVFQAEQGRRAATTLDRILQGVSLTARREHEGPYVSRMFTSLEGIEPLSAVEAANTANGYTPEEATSEAARCIQCECLECVKKCVYLENYKGYPKKYARQIYNNESIVKGTRLANKMINSCMLCDQCAAICPNDFSMGSLCLQVRESMVRKDNMPASAFDFALEDLRFSNSEAFSLYKHAPGQASSQYLFFPGCQLCSSNPAQVERTYQWLRENLHAETGLALGCCGAPALWAGEVPYFKEILQQLRERCREMGNPKLVVACATCHDTLKKHAPDLELVTLWNIMAGAKDAVVATAPAQDGQPVQAIHDPCTARHYPELLQDARKLLDTLQVPVEELQLSKELTSCCGYGGLVYSSNPPLARKVAEVRAAESDNDFVAYCAMCRDNLAATGKRVRHILDIIFPDTAGDDPAARPSPTFSMRQDNKANLRRWLLDSLWQEESPPLEEYQLMKLYLEPDVQDLLEDRHILLDNVKRVIFNAEENGQKLHDPNTGHSLGYYQPVRVTYWVEYEPEKDGYRIFNAYSHRMVLPGGDV